MNATLPPPPASDDPETLLRWTVERFGDRAVLVSALGLQSLLVLDLLHEAGHRPDVVFLDTGMHFPETLEHARAVERRWGIALRVVRPAADAPTPFQGPTTTCCQARKVAPLRSVLSGYDAWISGIRADQTAERAQAEAVAWDPQNGLWKINPFLRWSRREVLDAARERRLPQNPLLHKGYASVGCWPCSAPSDDERAGRFPGETRRECGLHTTTGKAVVSRLTRTR